MTQHTQTVLPFARLSGKILQADFEGGTLTSDGGVLFLREIEAHIGVIGRFVGALDDPRDPRYTDFSYEELLRQRIFKSAAAMTMPTIATASGAIRPSKPPVIACRLWAKTSRVSRP